MTILFELRRAETIVISTTEGKKGIKLARADFLDVIILDLGLPDIDGFELLRRIRNFSDVPITILNERYEEVDKVKWLEFGADDYITRSFYPDDFLDRVKAVLQRNSMHEEPEAGEKHFVGG